MSRFAVGDPELAAHLRAVCAEEQASRPDALLVEVLHTGHPRAGNIAQRPNLRDHTLRLFVDSDPSDASATVEIGDILVKVISDRVVLTSRQSGREILPRFTTALAAHQNAYPLVNFLQAVETQGQVRIVRWSWSFFETAAFLRRLVLDDVVIAPAQWNVARPVVEDLARALQSMPLDEYIAKRQSLGLPQYVGLVQGDNVLPVDLDASQSVAAALATADTAPTLRLREVLSLEYKPLTHVDGERFAHELVLPFLCAMNSKTPALVSHVARLQSTLQRQLVSTRVFSRTDDLFPPGSSWVFAKVYGGPTALDGVLKERLPELLDALKPFSTKWFFIRYMDPSYHLRLRVDARTPQDATTVYAIMAERFQPLITSGSVSSLEFAPYVRETERYGGTHCIPLVEQVFAADSSCAIHLCRQARDAGSLYRWHLAVISALKLLESFHTDRETRQRVAVTARDALRRQFRLDGEEGFRRARGAFALRFRTSRPALVQLLQRASERGGDLWSIFDERRRSIQETFEGAGPDEIAGVRGAVPAMLHMLVNRLLRSRHAQQEIVLYDALAQLIKAEQFGNARRVAESSPPSAVSP